MIAKNDREWHDEVCRLSEYICQGCLKDFSSAYYFCEKNPRKNLFLCGHHELRKGANPGSRLDVRNGTCVCLDCHQKIHDTGCHAVDLNPKSVEDFFI